MGNAMGQGTGFQLCALRRCQYDGCKPIARRPCLATYGCAALVAIAPMRHRLGNRKHGGNRVFAAGQHVCIRNRAEKQHFAAREILHKAELAVLGRL